MEIINGVLVKIEESDIIDGILEIPDGVVEIKEALCFQNNHIIEVKIPDTVEKIGSSAFSKCINLKKVTLPKKLTVIEKDTFYNDSALERINIPYGIEIIEEGAFCNCANLKSIQLPDSVKEIKKDVFAFCKSLEEIKLPKKLVSIGNMAFSNTRIGEIKIPENVKYIGSFAFSNCANLKEITLSKKLTAIEKNTFCNNPILEKVNLPDGIEVIGEEAFFNCKRLRKINLPDSVKEIKKEAFSHCHNLEEVKLSEDLISIDDKAFIYAKIKKIEIPGNIKHIGTAAFSKCDDLEEVTLLEGISRIEDEVFCHNQALEKVNIPNGVESIGENAFSNCPNLRRIDLPDSVKEIKTEAFAFCEILEEVRMSKELVSIANFAFMNTKIRNIEFSKSLEFIGNGAFQQCSELRHVVLPEELSFLGKSAFSSCRKLEEVQIPGNLKEISSRVFRSCSNLKRVNLPDSIEIIDVSAFEECNSLESIKLPKSLRKLGKEAFYSCDELVEIIVPGSVEEIGMYAFSNCEKLRKVVLEEGVVIISKNAFSSCENLEEVTLPESLIEIHESAFENCFSLGDIELPKNLSTIGEKSFDNCHNKMVLTTDILKTYLYLYANSILKDKYQTLEEFMSNKAIQKTINDYEKCLFSKNGVQKFKNLFCKLRKQYDIDKTLFTYLDLKITEEFSYSIWNKVKEMLPISCEESDTMCCVVAEMMKMFGIFVKDKKQTERLKQLERIFNPDSMVIRTGSYEDYITKNAITTEQLNEYFKKTKRTYYYINDGVTIPEEFSVYLDENYYISEEEYKSIKKLDGNYGKRINDFIRENYHEITQEVYLQKKPIGDKEINKKLFNCVGLENRLTSYGLHNIFDGCKEDFDEDFYQFFLENLPFIKTKSEIQTKISEIQKQFKDMKQYYLNQSGTKKITLKQACDYINNTKFSYRDGNFELLMDAKKAGVTNQAAFDYYQDVFETNQIRKKRFLLPRSNIYEMDGYTIKAELLRKDDPLSILVGETNYTNCCQKYNGIGHNCMAHATSSEDGGIFVTKLLKNGEWILLTESWDWQNNNLYCHDNVEGTEYLKKAPESLRQAVLKVIKFDAEFIMKKSQEEITDYVNKRKQILEKHPIKNRTSIKQLNDMEKNSVIKVVTCGSGYNDLKLENFFPRTIKVNETQFISGRVFHLSNFQPVNYNNLKPYFDSNFKAYSDAKDMQYIIAGDIRDIELKDSQMTPIYRDERRIVKEERNTIRNYTKNKISQIEKEAYDREMQNHNSTEDLEDSIIYLGEDWYLIFEPREDNSIYISDLARINPNLEDEKGIQQDEIMSTVYGLINENDYIEADLKEDTSYLLYLINKRLGYIEQIGEDISYPYDEEENTKAVTKEEQQEILKQRKQIREAGNPNLIMHKVLFKKRGKSGEVK